MDGSEYKLELLTPDSLTPKATTDLVITYTNRSEFDHHLNSIYISPTWNLDEEFHYPIDITIPEGESGELSAVDLEVPAGVGGRQGVRVGIKVSQADDDQADHKLIWKTPELLRVQDAARYRSIVCLCGSEENFASVLELIQNWGFDVYVSTDSQDLLEQFQEDDPPICVFGVLLPEQNGSENNGLIKGAAITAISRNKNAVIFKHNDAESPDLPNETIVIEFEDEMDLRTQAGPVFLGIRELERTGLREKFIQKIVRTTKRKPRELLNDIVNGVILAAAAKVGKEYVPTDLDELLTPSLPDEFQSGPESQYSGDYIDLTHLTEADGQPFVLRAFDATHPVWEDEDYHEMGGYNATKKWWDQFHKQNRLDQLPFVAATFTIGWDKYPQAFHGVHEGVEIFSSNGLTDELKIVLPARGAYVFEAEQGDKSGKTWMTRGGQFTRKSVNMQPSSWGTDLPEESDRTLWKGSYHDRDGFVFEENSAKPITVYVPVGIREAEEEYITWYWD